MYLRLCLLMLSPINYTMACFITSHTFDNLANDGLLCQFWFNIMSTVSLSPVVIVEDYEFTVSVGVAIIDVAAVVNIFVMW